MSKLLSEVQATRRTFKNDAGLSIVALESTPRSTPSRGCVVMPAPWGLSMRRDVALSWFLNRHGWSTLRFDLTHNSTASEGVIADATVSGITLDIKAALAQIDARPRFLFATSVCARAAIRYLSMEAASPVDGVVLVVPVVDVRYTSKAASGVDGVDELVRGRVTDLDQLVDVFSFKVKYRWSKDIMDARFDDVATTRKEITQIRAPVLAISARTDDLVRVEDIAEVMSGTSPYPRKLVTLEANAHEIGRNPEVARQLAEIVLKGISGEPPDTELRHFELDDVLEAIQTERGWSKAGYTHPDLT
jgi:hypothetical protein